MRIKALAAGVVTMTALSTMVLTPGIAAADDYAGQKYSDVTSALADCAEAIASETGKTTASSRVRRRRRGSRATTSHPSPTRCCSI